MADRNKSIFGRYRILVYILVPLLAAAGVFAAIQLGSPLVSNVQPIPVENTQPAQPGGAPAMPGSPTRVPVQLSQGQPQPQPTQAVALASKEPLAPDEIAQLLSRLPDLLSDPQAQMDFKLPQQPIPPPRSGETIDQPFPPDQRAAQQPTPQAAGPLQVLRFAPEGEIPIAPFVSVTFQPAHGAADHAGRPGRRGCAGEDRTGPARHLALAGHQNPDL